MKQPLKQLTKELGFSQNPPQQRNDTLVANLPKAIARTFLPKLTSNRSQSQEDYSQFRQAPVSRGSSDVVQEFKAFKPQSYDRPPRVSPNEGVHQRKHSSQFQNYSQEERKQGSSSFPTLPPVHSYEDHQTALSRVQSQKEYNAKEPIKFKPPKPSGRHITSEQKNQFKGRHYESGPVEFHQTSLDSSYKKMSQPKQIFDTGSSNQIIIKQIGKRTQKLNPIQGTPQNQLGKKNFSYKAFFRELISENQDAPQLIIDSSKSPKSHFSASVENYSYQHLYMSTTKDESLAGPNIDGDTPHSLINQLIRLSESRSNSRDLSKIINLQKMNQKVLELLQDGIRNNQIKRSKETFVFFTLDVFRNMVQINYKDCLLKLLKRGFMKVAMARYKEIKGKRYRGTKVPRSSPVFEHVRAETSFKKISLLTLLNTKLLQIVTDKKHSIWVQGRESIVYFSVQVFRNMLQINYLGFLVKLVNKRLVKLAVTSLQKLHHRRGDYSLFKLVSFAKPSLQATSLSKKIAHATMKAKEVSPVTQKQIGNRKNLISLVKKKVMPSISVKLLLKKKLPNPKWPISYGSCFALYAVEVYRSMVLTNQHDLLKKYFTKKMALLFAKKFNEIRDKKTSSLLGILNSNALAVFKKNRSSVSTRVAFSNLGVTILRNMLQINHKGLLKKLVLKRFSQLFTDKYIELKNKKKEKLISAMNRLALKQIQKTKHQTGMETFVSLGVSILRNMMTVNYKGILKKLVLRRFTQLFTDKYIELKNKKKEKLISAMNRLALKQIQKAKHQTGMETFVSLGVSILRNMMTVNYKGILKKLVLRRFTQLFTDKYIELKNKKKEKLISAMNRLALKQIQKAKHQTGMETFVSLGVSILRNMMTVNYKGILKKLVLRRFTQLFTDKYIELKNKKKEKLISAMNRLALKQIQKAKHQTGMETFVSLGVSILRNMMTVNYKNILKKLVLRRFTQLFTVKYHEIKQRKKDAQIMALNKNAIRAFKEQSKLHKHQGSTAFVALGVSIFRNILEINYKGMLKKLILHRFAKLFTDKYHELKQKKKSLLVQALNKLAIQNFSKLKQKSGQSAFVNLATDILRNMLSVNYQNTLKRLILKKFTRLFTDKYNELKQVRKASQMKAMNSASLKQFQTSKSVMNGKEAFVRLAVNIYRNMLEINHKGLLKRFIRLRFSQIFAKEYLKQKDQNKQTHLDTMNKESLKAFKSSHLKGTQAFVMLGVGIFRNMLEINHKNVLKRLVLKKFTQLFTDAYKELKQKGKSDLLASMNRQLVQDFKVASKKTQGKYAFVSLGVNIYRNMLQINHSNLLKRMIRIKFAQIFSKEFNRQRDAKRAVQLKEMNRRVVESINRRQVKGAEMFVIMGLDIFRNMMALNYKGTLRRVIRKKFVGKFVAEYYKIKGKKLGKDRIMDAIRQKLINMVIGRLNRLDFFQDYYSMRKYAVNIFRDLARNNEGGILTRMFKKRLLQVSLTAYEDYERLWQKEIITQLMYRKLISMALSTFAKLNRSKLASSKFYIVPVTRIPQDDPSVQIFVKEVAALNQKRESNILQSIQQEISKNKKSRRSEISSKLINLQQSPERLISARVQIMHNDSDVMMSQFSKPSPKKSPAGFTQIKRNLISATQQSSPRILDTILENAKYRVAKLNKQGGGQSFLNQSSSIGDWKAHSDEHDKLIQKFRQFDSARQSLILKHLEPILREKKSRKTSGVLVIKKASIQRSSLDTL